MTLRKVPGALVLGLLASLAAHALLYGSDHAMGGGYNAAFLEGALAGALGLLVGFGALAWGESGRCADGSVLAARLRERLPTFGAVAVCGIGWYATAEAIEPHHGLASPLALAISLGITAWLARRLARGLTDLLARAVVGVARLAFAPRAPLWTRRKRIRPLSRRVPRTRRHLARPPPIAA